MSSASRVQSGASWPFIRPLWNEVSANNFIRLPSAKVASESTYPWLEMARDVRQVKSMGLTGEYIYLLLKPVETKHFLIHLDCFAAAEGSPTAVQAVFGLHRPAGFRAEHRDPPTPPGASLKDLPDTSQASR